MSTPTPGQRRLLGSAVGTVLAVGLLLSGCSSSGSSTADDQRPAPTGPTGTAGTNGTGRPGAATTAPARALDGTASPSASRSAEPTLPPGDPGADAPGTDDPNADATEPETPAAPAGRHPVPADAVVDAGTLGSITGSPWHAGPRP